MRARRGVKRGKLEAATISGYNVETNPLHYAGQEKLKGIAL